LGATERKRSLALVHFGRCDLPTGRVDRRGARLPDRCEVQVGLEHAEPEVGKLLDIAVLGLPENAEDAVEVDVDKARAIVVVEARLRSALAALGGAGDVGEGRAVLSERNDFGACPGRARCCRARRAPSSLRHSSPRPELAPSAYPESR